MEEFLIYKKAGKFPLYLNSKMHYNFKNYNYYFLSLYAVTNSFE